MYGKGGSVLGALAVAGMVALGSGLACAQEAVHVLNRPNPDYDPVGGRVGSFFIFPRAEVETRYDSNIFALDHNVESDVIGVFKPAVKIQSDWSRHALNAEAGAEIGRYGQFESENYEDVFIGIDGRLDVLRSTTLFADLDLSKRHEDRGSPDDVNGETPTEYYDVSTGINGAYQAGRIALFGDARLQFLDFDDVRTAGGTAINNDDRDRRVATASGRVGYEIIRDYLAFIRTDLNDRDYVADTDDGGVDRDSQGYGLSAGMQFRLGGIARGEVSAGWRQQFYEDDTLQDFDGYSFQLGVTWFATELTTVDVTGARTFEETTLAGASGYAATSLRLDVAHELRRNIVLTGSLGAASNDYEGVDRVDHVVDAELGARLLINRNVYAGASYEYRMRESDAAADYRRNIVMLRGGVRF